MQRGFFLVLEGPEAAGKSTLVRAIAQRMREDGVEPVLVREPGGTPVAEALRHQLLDAEREWTAEMELLYLTTARADLVSRVIRPALGRGEVVLSDRYDLSTMAYQGGGRQLPLLHVRWVNAAATGGLAPDLMLVLDVDPVIARERQTVARKGLDRVEREPAEFHARVAAAYREVQGAGIMHVDAGQAQAVVLRNAWAAIVAARPDRFQTRDDA